MDEEAVQKDDLLQKMGLMRDFGIDIPFVPYSTPVEEMKIIVQRGIAYARQREIEKRRESEIRCISQMMDWIDRAKNMDAPELGVKFFPFKK